jgi:hypothetical protein
MGAQGAAAIAVAAGAAVLLLNVGGRDLAVVAMMLSTGRGVVMGSPGLLAGHAPQAIR